MCASCISVPPAETTPVLRTRSCSGATRGIGWWRLLLPAAGLFGSALAGHSEEAAKGTSSVVGWGYNGGLIIMKGEKDELPDWVAVRGMADVVSLSAGGMHNLALAADGTVWAWGMAPELKDCPNDGLPVKVPQLDHVVSIAAGSTHDLAVKSDGTVWTWGMNVGGAMGKEPKLPPGRPKPDDAAANVALLQEKMKLNTVTVPEQLMGIEKVVSAAAGDGLSLFVKSDGTVWACGVNTEGQLGIGAFDKAQYGEDPAHSVPAPVPGLEKIVSVALADDRGNSGLVHVLALDADGVVWTWGTGGLGATTEVLPSSGWHQRAADGMVFLKPETPRRATPAKVWGLPKIKRIAACGMNNVGVSEDGRVFAWGGSGRGGICPRLEDQLELDLRWQMQRINTGKADLPKLTAADSTMALLGSMVPVEVQGLDRVEAVAVNRDAAYALKSDGTVMAWGKNDWATLGSGKNAKAQPKAVVPVPVANLIDASGIAAAGTYALAIRGKARSSLLKWYLEFSKILKSRTDIINRVRGACGFIATPLAELRANNLAIIKIVQNPAKTAGIKEQAIADLRAKLARQSLEIRRHLDRLTALEKEGTTAAKDILDHLNKGFDAYGANHLQRFLTWKKKYEGMAKRLPFDLAVASGDDDQYFKLAEEFKFADLPIDLRVRIAKRLLDSGNVASAYEYARSAVAVAPRDSGAKQALLEVQLVVLSCALAKSNEAVGQAREAFEAYLTATGYPATDYSKVRPLFVRMLMGPLDETNRAEAWALITHGIVNVSDRIAGRLGGEELKLNMTTKQMTERFMGLQMIRLLLNRGHSMEDIQKLVLKPDGIRSVVPLVQPDGTPYTELQLNGLHLAVLSALNLPEIKALVDPNTDLRLALGKPYFDRTTVANTAIDAFGARLVSDALLLAVPMAEMAAVGGEVITVTEFAAQLVRWDRIVSLAGGTRVGKVIYEVLSREQRLADWLVRQDLLLSFAALKGAQLVGMFVLQKAMAERAEAYGGPYAAAFVQALIILSSDLSLLAKWLKAGQIEKKTAERICDKFIAEGKALQKRIETRHAEVVELRKLLQKKKAGETLTPEETRILAQQAETLPGDFVPNGSAANDGKFANKVAAEEGMQGAEGDADEILGEFDERAQGEGEGLGKSLKQADDLKARLASAPEPPPTTPQTISYNPEKQAPGTWGPYQEPPTPILGKNWAKADEAMANGNYQEAHGLYEKAAKSNEMPDDLVDIYQARSTEAALSGRMPPPENAAAATTRMTEEIPPATAEELLVTRWNERVALPAEAQGGTSRIAEMPGHPDYLVKEIVPIPGKIEVHHLEQMGESEVVASALARELKIPYPATAVRLQRNALGEVESVRLLMRRIKGQSLKSLSSGEVYHYRADLAESKAFAHLISDYDRKLDNFMRCVEDGRIYYLDGAMADIRSAAFGRGAPEVDFTNRGFLGIDHWYARSYKYAPLHEGIKISTPGSTPHAEAVKNHLAERALTYQDALPAIKRIHDLMKDEARLRRILTDAYQAAHGSVNPDIGKFVNEAVDTLKIREGTLEEMMRCLNKRSATPLPEKPTGFRDNVIPFGPPGTRQERATLQRAA